jgi:(R,R)-butanediol dehydrogenase / meso-butanediol dehydrogenase / diacetyl reductase
MKAAAFQAIDTMSVIDVPRPAPAAGEVLLKVHDCGICGSDLHVVQHGMAMRPGGIMGHEFCGAIAELGAGVSGFKVGDRVTSLPYISCGKCEQCRRGAEMYCDHLHGLGLGQLSGAYAEYVICGERSLLHLPDKVSSREGALVEPLSVALHGVKRAQFDRGAGCVVMGAGPIGLATILWCKAKGVETVVVSELAPGRTELALKMGASAVVNPNENNPSDKVRELTGREPEVVFECIGIKSTLMSAVHLAARRGQIVVIGVCLEPDQITPLTCIAKELRIDFSMAYTHEDFRETIDALATGMLDAKPMITDVIGIDEVPAMFNALKKPGSRAKVLVEFPH